MSLNEYNKKDSQNTLESTSKIKSEKHSIADVREEIKQVNDDFFKKLKVSRFTMDEVKKLKALNLHRDSAPKDFFRAYKIIGIDYKELTLKDLLSKVRHLYNIFLPHIEDNTVYEVLKVFRPITLHLNDVYSFLKDDMNPIQAYLAGRDLRIMLKNTEYFMSKA
ncbi:MAG: hypothetical protein EA412_07015 [Chitinophagaceae bacterium]|nr:MAG: hypothetical protein EA412_07015 [Chitinophagaceae bacterium]